MAKQHDGITGGYSGKVGPVVGYNWRGQWCLRARPTNFHDARSERQLHQRALFAASVAFAGRVKDVLRVGLQHPALEAHKTECNYFLMLNKGCLSLNGEALEVDYTRLRVSEGPVAPVAFLQPELQDDSTITIHFEKNPEHRRADAYDKVYVAAFRADTGEAVLSVPAYRRMRVVTLALPAEWAGQEVHLHGFVQDNAGRTSDSSHIGSLVLDYEPLHEPLVSLEVHVAPASEPEPYEATAPQDSAQEASPTPPQQASPEGGTDTSPTG